MPSFVIAKAVAALTLYTAPAAFPTVSEASHAADVVCPTADVTWVESVTLETFTPAERGAYRFVCQWGDSPEESSDEWTKALDSLAQF